MITKVYTSIPLLFSLLFCFNVAAQSNIPISFPVDYISQFQDIYVDDTGVGYVVGSCGVLRKTEDAGQSWNSTTTTPTADDISSVECAPSGCSKALLSTDFAMLRLENNIWTDVTYEGYNEGGQLHWLTDQIVVHETKAEQYYRSVDGGLTWALIPFESFQTSNMSILDDGNGYVVVDKKLFKTTNQWESIDSVGYTHSTNIFDMTWLDANTGWFFDQDRLFYATTDGGINWTLLNAESQLTSVNWMVALSSTHLVGAKIVTNRIESFDGGVTWESGNFLENGNKRVNSKYHRQGDAFYLVGSQSQLLYSESGFTDFEELVPFDRFRSVNRIVFESDDIGYGLDNTEFIKTTDGGQNWFKPSVAFGGDDIGLLDNGAVVLISGGSSKISMDQATTFTPWLADALTPEGEKPTKFAMTPNGNIYLMSYNYGYLSTDGGMNFTAINTAHDFRVTGLFFLDENNGYAVGRQSQYMYTSDGGQSWTIGEGPANNSVDVYFTDVDNGWVNTASSRYITTDRGETWMYEGSKGGYDTVKDPVSGALFVAKYASGNNGILNRSIDNGATWTELVYNCFSYRSGAITPSGKYFFTGGNSFIVRHDLEALLTGTADVRLKEVKSLSIFPNPTTGEIEIKIPTSSSKSLIEVYDDQGRRLSQIEVQAGQKMQHLSLAHLPAGMYLIRWLAEGQAGVSKVLRF